MTLADVDGVAVTNRPGLVGALLVGVQAAKGLAWAAGKPLVGVDHLMGHLLAVFLRRGDADAPAPRFPFVCLLASGGHTAIYRVDAPRADAIVELGATRDDAAGEAFDKVAKLLGLGYPGGPAIDRLAPTGDASRVKLSAPMAARGSLEMSFSGIKTQVAQLVAPARGSRPASDVADVCAAFQDGGDGVLARKVVDAARREGVDDVVLGGGVAANRELRRARERARRSARPARPRAPARELHRQRGDDRVRGSDAPRAGRARRVGPRGDERDRPSRARRARAEAALTVPRRKRALVGSRSCLERSCLPCLLAALLVLLGHVSSSGPSGASAMTSVSPCALTW